MGAWAPLGPQHAHPAPLWPGITAEPGGAGPASRRGLVELPAAILGKSLRAVQRIALVWFGEVHLLLSVPWGVSSWRATSLCLLS